MGDDQTGVQGAEQRRVTGCEGEGVGELPVGMRSSSVEVTSESPPCGTFVGGLGTPNYGSVIIGRLSGGSKASALERRPQKGTVSFHTR